MRLCDDGQPVVTSRAPGQLSVLRNDRHRSIASRSDLGHDRTITFFNDSRQVRTGRSRSELCDVRSGVICSPNNFAYATTARSTTARCASRRWPTSTAGRSLDEDDYRLEKLRWYDRITASAVRFVPDFRGRVIDTDMFTPTTIVRFTGHDNGAVYGAPRQAARRPHAPREPVRLRHRPRLRRHHRHHHQRHRHGQPALPPAGERTLTRRASASEGGREGN